MVLLGQRFQAMFHACREGNWLLGAYQCRAIRKLFHTSKLTRPKYTQAVDEFLERYLVPIEGSIRAKDWGGFAAAMEASVKASDQYHKDWGYEYIRYRLSTDPATTYRLVPPPTE